MKHVAKKNPDKKVENLLNKIIQIFYSREPEKTFIFTYGRRTIFHSSIYHRMENIFFRIKPIHWP